MLMMTTMMVHILCANRTISNITAGNQEQIEQVIGHNVFPLLVDILEREEFDIKKEAAWAVSNATSGGTRAQLRYLANTAGVMRPLIQLLQCPDVKIIMVRTTHSHAHVHL